MKRNIRFATVRFPAWLFVVLMVLYNEGMLHCWITETLHWGRVAAIAAFALGFGGVLALITSLIPNPKGAKWTAIALASVVTVIWVAEFFISDAYQVFMDPGTVINGAGGVAEDFFGLVVSLVLRDLWRIVLMVLPIVLYALFCRTEAAGWKLRGGLAALAAAGYLLGVGAVNGLTNDTARFTTAYNFDSVVRCFGMNMALTLETVQSSAPETAEEFLVPATMPPASAVQESVAEETAEESTEPAVVYGENVMEAVDFAALAEKALDPRVKALHNYVNALTPSKQNEYTGLFEGKNLILITAEAFSKEVLDPERTPTLYRMANEGIRFDDYYQPTWGASTTSGEFSNVVGLVPTTLGMCMKEAVQQDLFLTMGHQLQNLGYYSMAVHNHLKDFYDRDKTHTHLGYDRYLAQYGGLEGVDKVWPESDLQMIDVTVPQYIDQQPFSVYYMTVSGHCVYSQNENVQSRNHYDVVADLPYSETVKCYLASQMELEYAMESLLRQLEEAGIAEDTVVVIGTDHYPYGLERSRTWKNVDNYLAELYGVDDYDSFYRDHSALIIWSGCLEDMDIVVEEPVYSLDILPTLSNLFGVEYDSRLLIGRDVFSDEEPIVLWPDYSWKTNKGCYSASTGEFTPAEGVEADQAYVDWISGLVSNKIRFCREVMDTDYYDYVAEAVGR